MRDAYRVNLFLDRKVWDGLRKMARERAYREGKDVTASVLVREAVREYMKRHGGR